MSRTKTYNSLSGESYVWAKGRRYATREYCVRVHGMRRRPTGGVEEVAGNGEFGFSHMRQSDDPVKIVTTVDGQGFRKSRKSVVKPRKNPSKLWNTFDCEKNTEQLQRNRKCVLKFKRARNRNRKSVYGRKR